MCDNGMVWMCEKEVQAGGVRRERKEEREENRTGLPRTQPSRVSAETITTLSVQILKPQTVVS